jgi:DnaJ-class molecular chaperone
MSTDYYTILEVEKTASEKEIKTAFRKLAHVHHPDKGGDEKRFKEINEAYQTLSNKEKRAQYDRFGQSAGGFSSYGGPTAGRGNTGQYGGFSAQGGPASGWNMNYGDFARSGAGSQFNMFSLKKIPVLVWILLLPIIIVIVLVGLFALFLWISFKTLQTVRR